MIVGKHQDITQAIIGSFRHVHTRLGYGFSEKIYENALAIELRKKNVAVQQQATIKVFYDGVVIGDYVADLLVENAVIVELKSVRTLLPEHEAQLLNYLKATTFEVGLLLNFGPNAQLKRKLYDNEHKGLLNWTTKQTS